MKVALNFDLSEEPDASSYAKCVVADQMHSALTEALRLLRNKIKYSPLSGNGLEIVKKLSENDQETLLNEIVNNLEVIRGTIFEELQTSNLEF